MSDSASPVVLPFRAGRLPGETPDRAVMPPDFGASVTLLADVSEFQPDIADATYLNNFSKAIIIRAMYGDAHDDHAWYGGARRADLLSAGAKFLGIYQYIVASQDITAQAVAFCRLLGSLNAGEYLIADIEEGAGSQQQRWQTWAGVVHAELGWAPATYSGENFAAAHGLQPVDWVAAYGTAEPSVPHVLWQFTDSYQVPGVGVADCSVYHGTVDELAALAYGGSQPAPPPSAPAFPYPDTDYLGLESRDPHCHSGYLAADRPHIRTWQQQLARRGWTVGTDGIYGTQSASVCRAFQAEKGLATDGKVGPVTWRESWTAPVT